jgi:hypothetical protein
MLTQLTRDLLKRLMDAETRGKPLTATDLGNEVRGSAFEDAWESGYINQNPDRSVVVSAAGRRWYGKQ